jgi:hypothetical protein
MIAAVREYLADAWEAWNDFWFTATSPSTLSAIRVLAGAMLLYTHLIWTFDLDAFFGPNGWLPPGLMDEVHQTSNDPDGQGPLTGSQRLFWTHFDYVQSPTLIRVIHFAALLVFFLLTIGLFSRTMAVLAYLLAVSYANRITPGAYFGLDKINCALAMYLMLGPCGARYSVDRLWRLRRGAPSEVPPSISANTAIRLIQLHMCIIYFFAGIGKLQGDLWWLGEAAWYGFATQEYQSLDMTWLVRHPWLVNLVTHVTVFWELSYGALIWPRLTRPWVLLLAVLVHGGIAITLGMPTFGLAMLIGNLAFVSPRTIRRVFDPIARRIALAVLGSAGQGGGAERRPSSVTN